MYVKINQVIYLAYVQFIINQLDFKKAFKINSIFFYVYMQIIGKHLQAFILERKAWLLLGKRMELGLVIKVEFFIICSLINRRRAHLFSQVKLKVK